MKRVLTSPPTEESELGVIGSKDAAAHFLQLVQVQPIIPFGILQQHHPLWRRNRSDRITDNDKIPWLEQPFPDIPATPSNMATGAEAYPSLQTMNNLHITQELHQALQILVFWENKVSLPC